MQRVLHLRRLRAAQGAVSGLRGRSTASARVSSRAVRLLRAPGALYGAQEPLDAGHSRRWLSSTTASPSDVAEAVAVLKTRCNALYKDRRVADTEDEALAAWRRDVGALLTAHAELPSALRTEMCLGYESGVAIASKQRQFSLASALVDQMRELGLTPTPRTHRFLVRNVALELLAPPCVTPRADVERLLQSAGRRWEREILSIVRSEERSFYQKPRTEQRLLQRRLQTRVDAQLDAYERDCDAAKTQGATRSSEPYNEALRVLATHQAPFSALLDVLLSRPLAPDAYTYAALLCGARDGEIPAVLNRLLASSLVDAMADAPESSEEAVAALWEAASAAVTRSASATLRAKRDAQTRRQDVAKLRRVADFTRQQLTRAFPRFAFGDPETHARVYAARVRAAASVGQQAAVLRLLDEYAARSPAADRGEKLALTPYLRALELFPWSSLELLLLTRQDALARAERRDVARSRRVHELERMHSRLAARLARAKALLSETQLDDGESEEDAATRRLASRVVTRETRALATLARRLQDARVLKALQLLSEEHLARGDAVVAAVRAKLAQERELRPEEELELALTLLEQYAQSAVRFHRRLAERHRAVGAHLMRRVFALVETATGGALDVQDAAVRAQVERLFEAALRTATLLWRREDAAALVRKQRRVLGPDARLLPTQYDQLVFLRAFDGDVRGAYALLQEMHNAGLAPSQDAVHRVALGLLHLLAFDPSRAQRLRDGLEDEDDEDDEDDEEDEEDERGDEEAMRAGKRTLEDPPLTTETDGGHHEDRGGQLEDRGGQQDDHGGQHEDEMGDEDAEEDAEAPELELSDEQDAELAAVLGQSSQEAIEQELEAAAPQFADEEDAAAVAAGEARAQLLGSGAPTCEEDLAGFLQDWYSWYGVRPASKTVVPVLARLLATRNMPEFQRLLQLLEAMDGGLSPATQVWLERRLAQIGDKTLADFRL